MVPAPPLPAQHPHYLAALSDLRNARANLERKGGDRQMKWDEHDGVVAIDRAIHDIKEAALDDGKNLEDHPPVDAKEPRTVGLHKALAALQAARGDIDREEDNAFATGFATARATTSTRRSALRRPASRPPPPRALRRRPRPRTRTTWLPSPISATLARTSSARAATGR